MEILVKDIPQSGVELHFDSGVDRWFGDVLKDSLADLYQKKEKAQADFKLVRTGLNVDCRGQISCDCHPTCSRCLKIFRYPLAISFHLTLAPLYDNERQMMLEKEEEVELVKEDLEFSYYEGDRFQLDNLIREQLILEIPMQPVCRESCQGLCYQCGKDLNEGPCQCEEKHVTNPFAPLRKFKTK